MQSLYEELLNRDPSADELHAQIGSLGVMGTQGLALAFLRGSEFRIGVVREYYATLLHRNSDAGLLGWVTSGLDVGSIRLGIESSPEFFSNG